MKTREELRELMDLISSEKSPVGMDALYVHALILDKLEELDTRLQVLEEKANLPSAESLR